MNYDNERYKDAFSTRLHVAMLAAKMNGTKLAQATGINAATIYTYINGERLPRADRLAKMVAVLGCDANDLLGIRRKQC